MLALAERDGVPVDDVLVADASRRTTALNAYVSGFGGSRRVVLYDTLLEQAPPRGGRAGRRARAGARRASDDVLVGTLLGALGVAAAVCALSLLLSWPPVLRRSGADGLRDPRVVPLVLALVAVGTLPSRPASNLVSRRIEARADVHSLDLTRDPQVFAESQRRLALTNLSDLDPNPLAYALFATHPSTTERLALVREWERLRAGGRPPVRTLVVTNDFPPRPGGIQAFVHALAVRQPAARSSSTRRRGRAPRRSTPRSRSPWCATPAR